MGRYFLLTAVALVIFSGCARHYHQVKGDGVHLYLKKPDAAVVFFASSLDEYELHRAKKIDDDTWEIAIPAGREFNYFYTVDGVPFVPPCKLKENDDFGSKNCLFIPGM
jgi:hypothetical protein